MFIVFSLVFLGLFFIYLEFFLPGVILGIGGTLFLGGGFVLFYLQDHSSFVKGTFLLGEVICLILISRLAVWQIKKSRSRDEFYLQNDQEGYSASDLEKELIGKVGIALTDLKPSGHIQVEKNMEITQLKIRYPSKKQD